MSCTGLLSNKVILSTYMKKIMVQLQNYKTLQQLQQWAIFLTLTRKLQNSSREAIEIKEQAYRWILHRWQPWLRQSFWKEWVLIWALVSPNLYLKKTLAYVILLQFMINCFCLEKSKWIHLGMKLFSFCNYVLNQRSFKTSHVERVAIICISIVAVLGSLQEAKDDAVFQSDQSLPDAIQCQHFTSINPLFPKKSAPLRKKMISSFSIAKTVCRKKKAFKDNIRVSSLSAKSNKVNTHSTQCQFPPQDFT